MNKKWVGLLMAISLLVGAGCSFAGMQWSLKQKSAEEGHSMMESAGGSGDLDADGLEKISAAYRLIFKNYVEKVDGDKLTEGAIQGMLTTLNDPYSVYMDEKTAKQFSETLESSFEGIGAEVSLVDGKVMIVSPFKDSPAEKAGLKPNDQIVKIDGESIEGLDLYAATLKIRGEKGTTVKLQIRRDGLSEPLIVDVKRDEIPHLTVNSEIKMHKDEKIGYMEITSFSQETAKEFKIQLKDLEEEGIDGLLIDVRGNPGGLLTAVDEILEELVTKEKPYVQIEQRSGEKMMNFSNLTKKKDYPIGVLIDKGSASASEILAGALKEAGGYPLIGEKTYGKGTVQQPLPMGDGSNIKLTLYKWLTPDGNWIHKKGIEPSLEVKQPKLYHTHPLQVEDVLQKDMNNEQIKNAQDMLESLGYGPGRTDGYYSEATVKAVKAFQQHSDLTPTGQIDTKTASTLEQAIITEMKSDKNDLQLQSALRLITK
ncbi:S41 family peptidase [Cytobacillus purgationiresistens]|uniref:Carboxyl-terminal processing protease n=1 Tax=Cytobacillus purgationiresistens TaxID=863449 RepID=A0ABU0ACT7_9BACI|nr:S41 family peptidase [Cytobacillus purgationiresistens]MDQ0269071.1 carboxyl-terminal processing protease [Cytobacillus purgationiresistens]